MCVKIWMPGRQPSLYPVDGGGKLGRPEIGDALLTALTKRVPL